jgi:hypothetical protein
MMMKKFRSGLRMEESSNSNDKYRIVEEELREFNELIKGHRKLLEAIGGL